ncbi:glycosyl hydrolase family 43 protein [Cadophora sp. MPI-SDFR-AT-0126]|nr:glycosyl hydrolase family 43 protein [Leotiomycetes sp. MPI-SDFR-AT-0126]
MLVNSIITLLSLCAPAIGAGLPHHALQKHQTTTFTNPVIYSDFADNDITRGPDGKFYFSASNMHFSPGAPILRSSDLVNWESIGHSVPTLAFGAAYDMTDGTAYRRGTWASTMRYRASNGLWYWIGCVDFWVTYIYTASDVAGPWSQRSALYGKCYYDCGLLIDDDDTMYVVHDNTNVKMSQLSADGFSEVKVQDVFGTPAGYSGLEGNRLYKRNGTYYILDDAPSDGATFIWKASSVWGPWTSKLLIEKVKAPVGGGGDPDQGSLVETADGKWYFMSFTWAYPAGRMPILAPVTWGSDGFPVLTTVNGEWGASYPMPLPAVKTPSWTGTDNFPGTSLSVQWEWNHNPDTTKYSVNNGLTLSTATVTTDLYHARNTLTHRLYGPQPVGTVVLDFTNMADGDRTGLSAFRDQASYIGVHRSGSKYSINFVDGLLQNKTDWSTISNGTIVDTVDISSSRKVWLKTNIDARADGTKLATYEYSLNGTAWVKMKGSAALSTGWEIFMGYRFGIFNFASIALGGSVKILSFTNV